MVPVNTIFLKLWTRGVEGAGTNGNIYLGIGGKEFYVDSEDEDDDDFEAGNIRTYVFGEILSDASGLSAVGTCKIS